MALIKDNKLIEDVFVDVSGEDSIEANGPVIVGLAQWQAMRESLLATRKPLGIRLKSDESPELIAEDIGRFDVIALEFPAYSYARLLRERYGFEKELRAVGDVLMEQLHFMVRTGFDAFEIDGDEPLQAFRTVMQDFSVWYQPTGDGRLTARQLRHR